MSELIRITADRVISSSKGVKYYTDDGNIATAKKKEVKIFDTQEALDADIAADQADAQYAAANPETTEQAGTEDAQAAAPDRSTKRGKGKGKEQVATKKKAGKKAAAKKASNGALVRTVAGREHDISGYEKVKNASGHTSYDNGDDVATKLRGKTLDEVYAYAAKQLKEEEKALRAKYKHLNFGMQRMSLGNRLRKVLNDKAAA